jgi:hypothetical protein
MCVFKNHAFIYFLRPRRDQEQQMHVELGLFPTLTSVPGSGPPALQASHSAAGSSAAGHWSPAAGHHSWTAALSNY